MGLFREIAGERAFVGSAEFRCRGQFALPRSSPRTLLPRAERNGSGSTRELLGVSMDVCLI